MAESKSSASPPSSIDNVTVQITSIKLKGSSNYLPWAQAVRVYIMVKDKLMNITAGPPASGSTGYGTWMKENAIILIWLCNSMEPDIAVNVMFHTTAKGVWDDLKETYSQPQDKSMTRTYDLYEKLFQLKQSSKPVQVYYGTFKGLVEEFNVHQTLSADIEKLKAQRNEFFLSKFLAGLHTDLKSAKGHLLAGETIPTLDTYSRFQRIGSSSKPDSTHKDTPAFSACRGRGHGRGSGGGRTSGGRGFDGHGPGGQQTDRASRQCSYCGKSGHLVETRWAKHGKLEWAQQ
ncbi:uncharacterized protein LOC122074167 [Macadamia integrifolia]|uniref:uncharacterized protein LOC122074167 n=1 Tax=Macadamia integrifolia TaxID=60698 RepID=UPI001C4E842B|nr:uncharacterized protein LOC122074167 [Macadamia integrifolia]